MITIYKNIYDKTPYYLEVSQALERIKTGKSKHQVDLIRKELDKDRASKLKFNLPSVCFSGKFKERTDSGIEAHSNFIVLDFDNVHDLREKQTEIINQKWVYACWVSPSGNGLKALVRIADGSKHREHFQALQKVFPEIDKSGVNESRVCFESYDPDIYINDKATVFTKFIKIEEVKQTQRSADNEAFNNILKWLSNRGDSFVRGERNRFIFLLASACCRYGIDEETALSYITNHFSFSNDFTYSEAENTIKSGYRASKNLFGSAEFNKEELIYKENKGVVTIDPTIYDEEIRPKDVVFGEDVKSNAIDIYNDGYESVKGISVDFIDEYWKMKRGELTVLTGIGNYGKSTFLKWYLLMRAMLYNEKFALFAPEDNPAHEFYHECTEILLGSICTPANKNRPELKDFNRAYDFVSNHFFFIYPKSLSPTPDYIKERFLELIVKEKIDGCIIDPFNQMSNDYTRFSGRTDKYLEFILSDIHKFARENNVYLTIVAHPHKMMKDQTGNYPCPDVFDLADGAMWNNKCDNIIVFHRTSFQTNPDTGQCEFHSKKIRRQRSVGKRGFSLFEYDKTKRRFTISGTCPMNRVAEEMKIDFAHIYRHYKPIEQKPLEVKPAKPSWYEIDKQDDGWEDVTF
jgi:hypothetical protein